MLICSNMAVAGDFTPVLAKHSKSFSLIDCISVGVDRMQRNFESMRKQVEAWQKSELTLRHSRNWTQSLSSKPQRARRIPGSLVLKIVLVCGAVSAGRRSVP